MRGEEGKTLERAEAKARSEQLNREVSHAISKGKLFLIVETLRRTGSLGVSLTG